MLTYCIDIETAADPEGLERALSAEPEFAAPGNYKDADKIAACIDGKRQEWRQKVTDSAALSPLTGRVASVGLVGVEGHDAGRHALADSADEGALLRDLEPLLASEGNRVVGRVIGFNSRAFDFPFIRLRLLHHGMPIPKVLLPESRYAQRRQVDLRELLTDYDRYAPGKLADWCWLLGIQPPEEHTGEQIAAAAATGDDEYLRRIVMSDTDATAALWERVQDLAPDLKQRGRY